MAKNYVIAAEAALVNLKGSLAQLMHHGAPVPADVDPKQLQHMLDNGIVVEGEPVGGLAPIVLTPAQQKAAAEKEAADKAAAEAAAKSGKSA